MLHYRIWSGCSARGFETVNGDDKNRKERELVFNILWAAGIGRVVLGMLIVLLIPAALLGMFTVLAIADSEMAPEPGSNIFLIVGNVVVALLAVALAFSMRPSATFLLRFRKMMFFNVLAYLVGAGCAIGATIVWATS